MDSFGSRLQSKRKKMHLTLSDLSKKTGLSAGFISNIEKGRSQPSISSLKKLMAVLGNRLLEIDNDDNNGNPGGLEDGRSAKHGDNNGNETFIKDAKVVRKDLRKKIIYPFSPVVYELLTPDLNRRMQVMYFKLDSETGYEAPAIDPGEKFILILSGKFSIQVGEEKFLLETGDSLSYPSDKPVSYQVIGKECCELLLILSPPQF